MEGSASKVIQNTLIRKVHLAHADLSQATQLWDVECIDGRVKRVSPASNSDVYGALSTDKELPESPQNEDIDGGGGVLIPSLCHAHIHLDKCFILGQCEPLTTGSLPEALRVTNKAKATFPQNPDDFFDRASRLIRESVESGVTCMRAYVEVDTAVELFCLDGGFLCAKEWAGVCDVQIVGMSFDLPHNLRRRSLIAPPEAFAQEALYSDANSASPGRNYELLVRGISKAGVSVIGSAPWVEPSIPHARKNITHILGLAMMHNLHADFHLDYNVDPETEPMVWYVIDQMREMGWTKSSSTKCVTLGHATRLGLFTDGEWIKLKDAMKELPLEIVGLPQSDMYMMGRPGATGVVPLGGRTLDVPRIWHEHGIHVALSVNNVENAFTPQGSVDPLTLASLGVGVFQAGTEASWRELLRAVTVSSKSAIGLGDVNNTTTKDIQKSAQEDSELVPQIGDLADFVIVHEARRWQSTVLNPTFDRTTVYRGRIVAQRKAQRWNAATEARKVMSSVS
ncbi:hypothetical protein BJ138DRAFT_1088682 [Hygrophoropsis aurantiaca]|uniref:Uncharacterized protein n=1 Tax=Hygrophoropsis aurantiaca TaxID=72124 RepID=A0ACB8A9Y6_9AGAM|nr:hypothetical protein BJ138DRAFT_1088682 [Hygrophoropsis aurantiaca]